MACEDIEAVAVAAARARGGQGEPVRWQHWSWPQVLAHRDLPAGDLALLPVGAIEQHGPHLPLDVDVAIAEALCLTASAHTGLPVLPTIAYANSLGHTTRWPGTLSLDPELLIRQVVGIATWLRAAGWPRLLLVNSHYGNDGALRCAMDHIRTGGCGGALGVGLINAWDLGERARSAYFADGADIHANRAETSLMLAIAPQRVGEYHLADDPDRTTGHLLSWSVAETSRNGVTGRPSEASAEEGRELLADLSAELAGRCAAARHESAPLSTVDSSDHQPSTADLRSPFQEP
jgi:creatinine amidohydrolase